MAGIIEVLGLKYLLCGVIPCFRQFKSVEGVTKFEVLPPMPVLDVIFHDFPKTLYHGEIRQIKVELSNKGGQAMKHLWIKSNDASSWRFGKANELDLQLYPSSTAHEGNILLQENGLPDGSIFSYSGTTETGYTLLKPNENTLLPLWIRGNSIGSQSCKLLFLYQSMVCCFNQDKGAVMRSFKSLTQLTVHPSLKIQAFTRGCACPPNKGYMRMEISNDCQTSISLSQITTMGTKWTMENVPRKEDLIAKTKLNPNSSTTLYAEILRHSSDYNIEGSPEISTTASIEKLLHTGEITKLANFDIKAKFQSLLMVSTIKIERRERDRYIKGAVG